MGRVNVVPRITARYRDQTHFGMHTLQQPKQLVCTATGHCDFSVTMSPFWGLYLLLPMM